MVLLIVLKSVENYTYHLLDFFETRKDNNHLKLKFPGFGFFFSSWYYIVHVHDI